MIEYYKISTIKVKVYNKAGIDLSRFRLFKIEPSNSTKIYIKISKLNEIKIKNYEVILKDDIEVIEFSDGKHGSIFYSDEGVPVACLIADSKWENIEINYTQFYNIGNYSVVEHLFGLAFRSIVIMYDGLVIHSSAIQYHNQGIIFSAPSGTGKSTHTRLWKKYFDASIINDDTPVIIPNNDEILVCGTPWSGSTSLFLNVSVPLKAIVVLSQYPTNEIKKIGIADIIAELMPRCMFPYHNKKLMNKAIMNFEKIISSISVYQLKCTPFLEAAELVRSYIKL